MKTKGARRVFLALVVALASWAMAAGCSSEGVEKTDGVPHPQRGSSESHFYPFGHR